MISVVTVLSLVFGCGLGVVADRPSEPQPITVVVPDAIVAEAVREQLPRVRIVVLQEHAEASSESIAARAWEYRNADCFFFDPHSDTFEMAIVRERMRNHGVVPIDLRQQSLATNQRRDSTVPNAAQLAQHVDRN